MKITNIRRQAAAQSSGVPISEAAEAEDHGHPFARNLANNQSHTIGLLSDRITTDAFAGQLIRSALSTALLHNQLMLIGEGCLGCPNPCSIEQSSLGSRAGLSLGAICPYPRPAKQIGQQFGGGQNGGPAAGRLIFPRGAG